MFAEDIAGSIDCVMKLPDGTLALIDWKREEVLLQLDFIGDVTSCLVSLGQLYQGGWSVQKDEVDSSLSLISPMRFRSH